MPKLSQNNNIICWVLHNYDETYKDHNVMTFTQLRNFSRKFFLTGIHFVHAVSGLSSAFGVSGRHVSGVFCFNEPFALAWCKYIFY